MILEHVATNLNDSRYGWVGIRTPEALTRMTGSMPGVFEPGKRTESAVLKIWSSVASVMVPGTRLPM